MVVRQLHVADLCGEHPCVLWPLPSRVHDYSRPPREAIGRQWSLLISGPPEPHDTPAVLALDKAVGSAAQCGEPDRQGVLGDCHHGVGKVAGQRGAGVVADLGRGHGGG
jgi:hypothetical protein